MSRVALSRRVCGKLNWRSANGKLKGMSCRVALSKLDRRGVIQLPPLNHRAPGSKNKKLCEPIATPEPIVCSLGELGGVELIGVSSAESRLLGAGMS